MSDASVRPATTDTPLAKTLWLVAAAVIGVAAGLGIVLGGLSISHAVAGAVLLVAIAVSLADPRAGILMVMAAIPLETFGRIVDNPVPITAYQVLLVTVLVSWLWRVATRRMPARFGLAEVGAGLILFAGLWSLPFSVDWGVTLYTCGRILFEMALFVACIHLIDSPKWLKRAATVFTVTVVLVSLYGIAQYLAPRALPGVETFQGTLDRTDLHRVAAFFTDPNTLGGLTSMAAVAFLAAAAHAKRLSRSAWWLVAAGIAGITMLLTFSRGSWVALALTLPVVALTAPKERRRPILIGLAAVCVAAAVVAPGTLISRVSSAVDIQHDTSAATRYYMYISAFEMARDYPVFGTGFGAFDEVYPAYQKPQALPGILKPHEVPVSLVSETGLGGLAALIGLGAIFVVTLRRHRGRPWTVWESAAVSGLVCISIGSLFEYYLFFEYVWIFAALWVVASRLAMSGKGEVS